MHEKQGAERAQDEKPGCLWVAEGPSGGEGIRLVWGWCQPLAGSVNRHFTSPARAAEWRSGLLSAGSSLSLGSQLGEILSPRGHFEMSGELLGPTRTYCIAHRTLLSVMWQPAWERSLGNRYRYMYGWVTAVPWNYHSIVNWLYSRIKSKVKKKRRLSFRDLLFNIVPIVINTVLCTKDLEDTSHVTSYLSYLNKTKI